MDKKITLRIIFIAIGLIMIFIPTFLNAYFEMIQQSNILGLNFFGIPVFFLISIIGGIISIYGLYSTIKEMRKSYRETEEATLKMIETEYEKAKSSGIIEEFEEIEEKKISKIPELKVISASNEEVCPHCGSLNPLKTQKCESCGKDIYTINEEKISCPVCGAPLEEIPESGGRIMCKICFSEIQVIT
jgi:rRNA maturation protein Nop10